MKKRLLLTLLPLALLVAACSGGNGGGDETTSAEPASTSGAVATSTSGAAATSTSAAAATSTSAAPANQTTSATDTTPAATSSAAPSSTAHIDEGFETADWGVQIGDNKYVLSIDPAAVNEGAFADRQYGLLRSDVAVTAGDAITFYKAGSPITQYLNASGDDTAGGTYNNYVGTLDTGFAIQADAASTPIMLNVWKPNSEDQQWASFWIPSGSSSNHTASGGGSGGGSTPTTDAEYVLVGSFNDWSTTADYVVLAQDSEDTNKYTAQLTVTGEATFKVYKLADATYYSSSDWCDEGASLVDDGYSGKNVKVAAAGTYNVTFWVSATNNNHIGVQVAA